MEIKLKKNKAKKTLLKEFSSEGGHIKSVVAPTQKLLIDNKLLCRKLKRKDKKRGGIIGVRKRGIRKDMLISLYFMFLTERERVFKLFQYNILLLLIRKLG